MLKPFDDDEFDGLLEDLATQESIKGINFGIEKASVRLREMATIAFKNEDDKKATYLRDLAKQILLLKECAPNGAWEKIGTWIENNK